MSTRKFEIMARRVSLLTCALMALVKQTSGHGRLLEPAGRSTLWRNGVTGARVNYNDHLLNCGGYTRHWLLNGGNCGFCGDPFDAPKLHETGGRYARNIIAQTYDMDATIDIRVELTVEPIGISWFEFKLCNNSVITQECLDENLLELVNEYENDTLTRWDIYSTDQKVYEIKAELPTSLTCNQCVLQWKYHTGNREGVDPGTGDRCMGCGQQEEFYGCSDIRVLDPSVTVPIPTAGETEETTTAQADVTQAPLENCHAVGVWQGNSQMDTWCVNNCASGHCPASVCDCSLTTADPWASCRAVGSWAGDSSVDEWCQNTCASSECPATYCECD